MFDMEIKNFSFETKELTEEGQFEGYAAVFGNRDSWDDIIEPGAFAKTIKERASKIRVLWQHDWELLLVCPSSCVKIHMGCGSRRN